MKNVSLTNFLYPLKLQIEETFTPIVRKFMWINPSVFSFLNALSMILAGFSLVLHQSPKIAFGLLFISYVCDVLDGMVARLQQKQSYKGTFIDGSFDRLGEIGFFVGLYFSELFNPAMVLVFGLSSLFTNYLQVSLFSIQRKSSRSVLEKTDRNVYFFLIFLVLSLGMDSYISESFSILCGISIIANLQLMRRGFILEQRLDHNLSIPSNPDETTFDEDYNRGYYGDDIAS